MKKYICVNCGYIYDPENGDPMSNIPPGTAFEDLPSDWKCPMCYLEKQSFDPLD
jgi:rubredoxin